MIGDPGGKTEERTLLSSEELEANLAGIRPSSSASSTSPTAPARSQARPARQRRLARTGWGSSTSCATSGKHFTVNQMMAKESVRARLGTPRQGISFTEFSYMLLQAYDFLHLFDAHGCRLQLGGSDQWGNITMGIELIRKARQAGGLRAHHPAVLKADGTKFGKTESGTVWLDAAPDEPVPAVPVLPPHRGRRGRAPYLRYFTFLDHDTIGALDAATAAHPERARGAAGAGPRGVHPGARRRPRRRAPRRPPAALFSEEIATLDEATLLRCARTPRRAPWLVGSSTSGPRLVDALVLAGLAPSKSRARTIVTQGGAYVNNHRVRDTEARLGSEDLLFERYLVLRRGQRDYHLLRFE